MTVAAVMSEMANHAGKEPWVSLESASWWFDRASWVLAGSLLVGFVCTVVTIWMGFVKEHHWDLAREHAAKEIEGTKLDIAKAHKETAIARLATEKLRQRLVWRMIDPGPRKRIIERLKPFAPQKFFVAAYSSDDTEAVNLRDTGREILDAAGWQYTKVSGLSFVPGMRIEKLNGGDKRYNAAWNALPLALMEEAGIKISQSASSENLRNVGHIIAILIGKKPPSPMELPSSGSE